jgi:hypothetical protein
MEAKLKKTFTLAVLTLISFTFLANDVFAIPAFARKYKMTCKTCHSPFPTLKAYGDEFAGNGFQLKDKDAPRYYVETGDDDLSLLRELPVALRFEGYVTYNIRNSERTDFTAPWILKLLSGGAITKDISYYFYFFFSERGEIAGIEDAFLMFNDLFSTELDFMIGQYQVSDPLFKRELRLTFDDYMIYLVRPGYSNINLAYDRGVMFNYGFNSGTNINLQVLNGTGIGQATPFRAFDKDKYKNVFTAISQDLGEHFRIGVSGYYGNELIENPDTQLTFKNEIWMAGVDASASAGPLELNLQYVERRDKNPYVLSSPEDINTRGGLAELIFRPDGDESKWYGVLLYNKVNSDDQEIKWESLAFHLGYLVRRNIRIVGEYSYNIHEKFGRIGVGFITAF